MAAHTYSIVCPGEACGGKCGGEVVTAKYLTRTVEVSACSFLIGQRWTGPAVVLWHSQADRLVPADAASVWQHRDGLVSFAR